MRSFMHMACAILIVFALLERTVISQQSSGQCAMQCNDLRTEVLTLAMCREAKLTLPRPKVGDFCSTAMEQGFSDACIAICMGEEPVNRVAQTCRAASIEMPRPTVRKWCEHGYYQAYNKALDDLKNHFKQAQGEAADLKVRRVAEQAEEIVKQKATAAALEAEQAKAHGETEKDETDLSKIGTEEDTREVLAHIPIELNDAALTLLLHEGENAEDAVVAFCRRNAPEEMAACIRHVLPSVLERLEEGGASNLTTASTEEEKEAKEGSTGAAHASP